MINIYEERLVTITIDNHWVPTCERIHWVINRWGKENFELILPTPWEGNTMIFKFWVRLHPVDATRAIDEIWQAAQGILDIHNLTPILEQGIIVQSQTT